MPQTYTSYYGNRHLPDGAFRVQVSLSRPRRYGVSAVLRSAVPDRDTMTVPLREGAITEKEYADRYGKAVERNIGAILSELDTIRKAADGRPVVLLSYAGKDRTDSRIILAGQLRALAGIETEELL